MNASPLRSPRGTGWRAGTDLAVAVLALYALATACTTDPAAEPPRVENVAMPVDLEALDPPIRLELEKRHATVGRTMNDPAATDLQRSKAFGALGMLLHAYHYLEDAETCYTNASLLDPEVFDWAYLLGRVRRILGRWQASEDALVRALALRPGDVPTLVALADAAFDRDRLEDAEVSYREALERRPDCVRCLWGLGRALLAQNDIEAAVTALERALAWQPQAAPIHYTLGQALRAAGDVERAREHLAKVPPNNLTQDSLPLEDPLMSALEDLRVGARAHDFRGLKALAEGRFALAAIEFRQAMAADPDRIYAGYGLALAWVNLGRWDDAETALRVLIGDAPDHGPSLLLLARVVAQGSRYAEAETLLDGVLESDPDSVEARLELAALRRDTGRHEQAIALLDAILRQDPGHELARFWRTVTRVFQGRFGAALAALEEDRQVLPESRYLQILHARLLAASPAAGMRDGPRALELARDAAAASPTLPAVETVAMAYAELGQLDRAVTWQQAAVDAAATAEGDAAWANARLERYQRHRPVRRPWAPGEPLSALPVQPPKGSDRPPRP